MIGFGSIGRGTLPLIERHFKFDKSRMVVIDPRDTDKFASCSTSAASSLRPGASVTKDNYKKLLTPLLTKAAARASASTCRSTPVRSTSMRSSAASSACSMSTPCRTLARLLFRQ
jgi:homospermidine synthase